jgi:hypothetical protein
MGRGRAGCRDYAPMIQKGRHMLNLRMTVLAVHERWGGLSADQIAVGDDQR